MRAGPRRSCKFREAAFEARGNLAIFDFIAALRTQEWRSSTQGGLFDEIARLVPAYQGLTQSGLGVGGAFCRAAPPPPAGGVLAPPRPPPLSAADGLLLSLRQQPVPQRISVRALGDPEPYGRGCPYVEMSARDAAPTKPFGSRSGGCPIRPGLADGAAQGQQAFSRGAYCSCRKITETSVSTA